MKIVIATTKSWNIEHATKLKEDYPCGEVAIITDKNALTYEYLLELNPEYIFFPHWSWIIPAKIYENFECIVFHMTDLPFGRGGSPLQNLISREIYETQISAIRVEKGLDTGPVYLKQPFSLAVGSAEELYKECSNIIFNDMIPRFLETRLQPVAQEGQVIEFKRRTPKESELCPDMTLRRIYDYIRMLDAEGYPKAYIDFGKYRLEFDKADLGTNEVSAQVYFKVRDDI